MGLWQQCKDLFKVAFDSQWLVNVRQAGYDDGLAGKPLNPAPHLMFAQWIKQPVVSPEYYEQFKEAMATNYHNGYVEGSNARSEKLKRPNQS